MKDLNIKYKLLRLLVVMAIVLISSRTDAQWTAHLSMKSCNFVGTTNAGYVAGNAGGFFLKGSDGSLVTFTKANHLSDYGISALTTFGEYVYVGYTNGNLDIVDVNEFVTTNIPELKNYHLVDKKSINNIYKYGNRLYCSTSCGLVEINLLKSEMTSRYIIDANNVPIVNDVCIIGDSIYAATNIGLYAANIHSNSLENVSEWKNIGPFDDNLSELAVCDNRLLVASGAKGSESTIFINNNGKFKELVKADSFRNIATDGNYLLVTSTNHMMFWDVTKLSNETYGAPDTLAAYSFGNMSSYQARFSSPNTLIVADSYRGLITTNLTGTASSCYPNGPDNNLCLDIVSNRKGVFCAGGGVLQNWNNLNNPIYVHCYKNGKWVTLNGGARDALRIAYDKNNEDTIYVASWGCGILKLENGKFTRRYNKHNSILQDRLNGDGATWVGAIAIDNKSNLFASNALLYPGMVIKTNKNEWYPVDYPLLDDTECSRLIFTSNNNGWLIIPRYNNTGLSVFNINKTPEDCSDDKFRGPTYTGDERDMGRMKLWDADGEILSENPQDIVEDKEGVLWIGTDNGVVIFKDDNRVFDIDKPVFSRIKVPRNDGTNFADYLLDGIFINKIAIDGANRKWIATSNNGVFLVSADGTETIYSFNTDNSPLLSNEVRSVTVDPISGEVFFATYNGIISFRGDATESSDDFEKIRVYPNPVRPAYHGNIQIDGLIDGTLVRITDVNGRLVYSTYSLGGRATWNGRNMDGNRVATGVYLVNAVSGDGVEKGVARIAVIK